MNTTTELIGEKLANINVVHDDRGWKITVPTLIRAEFEVFKNLSDKDICCLFQQFGLIRRNIQCTGCGVVIQHLSFEKNRNPRFRCKRRGCTINFNKNAVQNTIFYDAKIAWGTALEILYQFSCRRTVADTSETLDISKKTVISFYKIFRASICFFLEKTSEKLGGDGVVIHFDETPMTTIRSGVGRHYMSNTVWVVGAVDINSRKCFLKFLPSRSRADLFSFLQEWILPGSVVHTDSHRSYTTLSTLGFTHFTVNHSREFVSRQGIHTNWIEGIFGSMKKMQRKYDSNWSNLDNLNIFLAEFCFRYSFDGWDRKKAFLKLLGVFKFIKEEMELEDQ